MEQFYDKDGRGWGFPTWVFLHAMADAYPTEPNQADRELMKNFFDCLMYSLPCDMCNGHLQDEMGQHPIQLQTRGHLQRWLFNLHNRVNRRTQKPTLSYSEATKAQEQMRHIKWGKLVQALEDPRFQSALREYEGKSTPSFVPVTAWVPPQPTNPGLATDFNKGFLTAAGVFMLLYFAISINKKE